ncbi:MAG: CytochromeP460 domain-containing protein [Nitrospira sp.]|nr:MAG: CytochromeP460 domain-containing protein [Nitrospira sp.]
MLDSFEMTRDAFVSAVTRKNAGDVRFNVVIVRLLAIALMLSRWQANAVQASGVPVPQGYRAWPSVESNGDVSGGARYLRLSVCPRAASVTDDETFPVGTALVVETFSAAPVTGGQLRSVFVMEKVSSLDCQGLGHRSQEGWAYATYSMSGGGLSNGAASWGLRRLPGTA